MSEINATAKSRLRCREIMAKNVQTANHETSLREVAEKLKEADVGILPIVEKDTDKLIGLITDRDIVVRAVAEGIGAETAVGKIMTTELFTAKPEDFAFEAIRTMGERQVRRVPIVDDEGILRGIIAMADIALEMEDEREIAETLEDISSGAGFWNKS